MLLQAATRSRRANVKPPRVNRQRFAPFAGLTEAGGLVLFTEAERLEAIAAHLKRGPFSFADGLVQLEEPTVTYPTESGPLMVRDQIGDCRYDGLFNVLHEVEKLLPSQKEENSSGYKMNDEYALSKCVQNCGEVHPKRQYKKLTCGTFKDQTFWSAVIQGEFGQTRIADE